MKLMLVCTSGGHFSTMKDLKSFWSEHERVWITDKQKDTLDLVERENYRWLPYQGPRDYMTLLFNLPRVFYIIYKEKPDLIISTGASLGIGFALAAKFYRKPFFFIESISRTEKLSLTGSIVYFLSDRFYVQWPQLCQKYPKAIFRGVA